MTTRRMIDTPHCQECGSTDEEDVNGSYSRCCNEIVVWGGTCGSGHCYHDGWGYDDDEGSEE